jgi:hypothetical protein
MIASAWAKGDEYFVACDDLLQNSCQGFFDGNVSTTKEECEATAGPKLH